MGQTISTAVDIACYLKAISTAKTQYWVINVFVLLVTIGISD